MFVFILLIIFIWKYRHEGNNVLSVHYVLKTKGLWMTAVVSVTYMSSLLNYAIELQKSKTQWMNEWMNELAL